MSAEEKWAYNNTENNRDEFRQNVIMTKCWWEILVLLYSNKKAIIPH
jgi:hypothetical protein